MPMFVFLLCVIASLGGAYLAYLAYLAYTRTHEPIDTSFIDTPSWSSLDVDLGGTESASWSSLDLGGTESASWSPYESFGVSDSCVYTEPEPDPTPYTSEEPYGSSFTFEPLTPIPHLKETYGWVPNIYTGENEYVCTGTTLGFN